MAMVLTIKDIAKKAGVSISTVSRVFNNKDLVKDETREKVLKVLETVDYIPNFTAKRLRENTITTIAIIVPDISVSFYAEMIKGVENKANEINCGLIVCDSHNSREKEREYVRYLYDDRVDGMIVVVPHQRDEELKKINDDGLSIVVFGRDTESLGISSITVDNFNGAYQTVKHLILHGYKKIAYIGGIEGPNDYDHRSRMAGYRQAMLDSHLEIAEGYIDNGAYSEEGGSSAFLRLISLANPPNAIFCANDEMALGVMKMAKRNNIKIPEEMGLVGFDNIRICQYTSPTLTTVSQPTYTIGVLLSERLIFKLHDKDNHSINTNLVLKPELIIRESCGCYR
jgi:LacI family transcriptional regulator